jgi:dTDP-4-amino-4,6-dideoxygalactose transaminase
MCVFSFHPVKIITTAEGGMVTTNDLELADKMKLYRSHGITKDFNRMSSNHGAWYYEQLVLGFNYRMNDIQAALGLSQLKKIDTFVSNRSSIAKRYVELIKNTKIHLPSIDNNSFSAWHLFIIRVETEGLRNEIFNALRADNIGVNIHYIPIYKQPYYKGLLGNEYSLVNAEMYYKQAISLPIYPFLSDSKLQRITKIINNIS